MGRTPLLCTRTAEYSFMSTAAHKYRFCVLDHQGWWFISPITTLASLSLSLLCVWGRGLASGLPRCCLCLLSCAQVAPPADALLQQGEPSMGDTFSLQWTVCYIHCLYCLAFPLTNVLMMYFLSQNLFSWYLIRTSVQETMRLAGKCGFPAECMMKRLTLA